MTKSYAPWTPAEVGSLMSFQMCGLHPFTCVNRGDDDHPADSVLFPTVDGWICAHCDYTQDWAHTAMADGSWADALTSWAMKTLGMKPEARSQQIPVVKIDDGEL